MSRCLAFFVFVSFYKIQVKRQKIWLYSGTKSHSVEFLCLYLYHFLFRCHEDRRFNRRNDLKFISKFWLRFWGRKCNLPSRACFEWQSEISLRAVSFYSLCEKRRLREPSRAFERTYAWIPAATEMNKTIQDEPERSNWAEKGSDCQSRQQN